MIVHLLPSLPIATHGCVHLLSNRIRPSAVSTYVFVSIALANLQLTLASQQRMQTTQCKLQLIPPQPVNLMKHLFT